jgi:hypothetical protein
MLFNFILMLKLQAFSRLDLLHQSLAGGKWESYVDEGRTDWISLHDEFDTISTCLSSIYLRFVCHPNSKECFPTAALHEFTSPDYTCDFTAQGWGIKICMRCLRSWQFPSWGRYKISESGECVFRVAIHPYMVNLPSLRDHFTPIKSEPTYSDQISELNWYGAIYPEFYLHLLYTYPEVFPDHLFGRDETWLRHCLHHVQVNLLKPVFLHPMFSGFSGGKRGWDEVQMPSVEECRAVTLAAKGRALRNTGGYENLSYF